MNWGIERSHALISYKTGFLIQGNSKKEHVINTNSWEQWKVWKNEGMHEKTVFWRRGGEIVGGFYAANPTDLIEAKNYPWGWQQSDYEDSKWQKAGRNFFAAKNLRRLGSWVDTSAQNYSDANQYKRAI